MIPRILVTSQGPLSAAATVFCDNHGKYVGTIVAKISYAIGSGIVPPLDEPLPIQEEDGHWDDDPARSVHVPSDLVPFKKAPEVVVVGSAYAPNDRPVASVIARVIVGSVDKSVELHVPRYLRDGSIEEGQRARRFPLRYEYAAGGPDSDNPIGIDVSRPDARGRRAVPQVLPVACDVAPHTTHLPTIGLGPLPTTYRLRSEELRPVDRAWIAHPDREPLPKGFSSNYFQSAPAEQWLTRPLAANERVVLENLHQRMARVVMTLPGIEPVAVFPGHSEVLRLHGDLLVIDSDRALCTLTFRGHLPISDTRSFHRAVVFAAPMGAPIAPEQIQNILQSAAAKEAVLEEELAAADEELDTTHEIGPEELAGVQAKLAASVLPFAGPASAPPAKQMTRLGTITTLTNLKETPGKTAPPFSPTSLPFTPAPPPAPRQPSYPDGMLGTSAVIAAPLQPPPVQPPPMQPHVSAPPLQPPPLPPMRQPSFADVMPAPPTHAAPPAPPQRVNAGRSLGVPHTPPPAPVVAPIPPVSTSESAVRIDKPPMPPPIEPAKPVSWMTGLRAREANASTSTARSADGTAAATGALGVQALSDAAAHEEKSRESRPTIQSREMPSRQTTQMRRLNVIDLLTFDSKIAPRLRGLKRLASLWAAMPKAKSPLSPDEPQRTPPDPDREIVLRVLSCVEGQTSADIRRALADSLEDLADFDPPLVICAGELQPKFDDLETLRVSVAVGSSVAGTDKRMLGAIAVAQEALAASIPPAVETLRNLVKQIETASLSMNLPPRFLPNHVERILVENRHYKRRTILGALRVRADLVLAGGDVFPMYLLDDAAKSLPLLPAFPVMAVCEARPREDIIETQPEALLCLALGRVLHARSGSAG